MESLGAPTTQRALAQRDASVQPRAALSIDLPRHPISLGMPDRSALIFRGIDNLLTPPGGAYVAQSQATAVNEYALPNRSNNAPVCTVAGSFVNGIGVNRKRVLYVPNGNGQIATFGPNCGAAGPVLSDPGQQPADVAFDGTKVYVDNASSGGIDVFLNGQTVKSRSLSNPAITGSNFGVGVDAAHSVFESTTNGVIVKYAGGVGAGTVLPITGLGFPIGIEFDKSQNMIVTDGNSGILIYAPPYSGAPTRTISFGGRDGFWGKLDAGNINLYVSDNLNATIDVYNYSTGAYRYSFGNGLVVSKSVEGVAIDPAARN
jgi:hypothetical protein